MDREAEGMDAGLTPLKRETRTAKLMPGSRARKPGSCVVGRRGERRPGLPSGIPPDSPCRTH